MHLTPLKSAKVQPGENLLQALKKALQNANQKLLNGDVLVVASKVFSYSEDRLVKVDSDEAFRELIKQESDQVFADEEMMITLKNHILIPNAGIDNSNTPNGEVILWPKDPFESANKFREALKKEFDLTNLGIIASDSHCQPLRWGTTGIAIGWAGLEGVQDERGSKDLFDRELMYTRIAVADDLAAAANLLMGEGNASIPFVIVREAPVQFTDKKASMADYAIELNECIYKSVYRPELNTTKLNES